MLITKTDKVDSFIFCCRMKTKFVLIACLAIAREVFGTQVYETPSDSSQQWQPWNQDFNQASNEKQEKRDFVTFDNPDTSQQKETQSLLYNANIQSSGSGVANIVGQQSVRILSLLQNIGR